MGRPRMGMTAGITLVLALTGGLFIAGSDACDNVPSFSAEEACAKACGDAPPLYSLCQETLRRAPDTAEAPVYAMVTGKAAKLSYEVTVAQAEKLLGGGSLPDDERAAYVHCKDRYAVARSRMVGVINEMSNCVFVRARQEYVAAVAAVDSCRDRLSTFKASPLLATNAADCDATMVAYDIGALLVGK